MVENLELRDGEERVKGGRTSDYKFICHSKLLSNL